MVFRNIFSCGALGRTFAMPWRLCKQTPAVEAQRVAAAVAAQELGPLRRAKTAALCSCARKRRNARAVTFRVCILKGNLLWHARIF